ncbi:MAG TPA: S8 family peptidase, partial [Pyrinomonadaceae bacterium]
MPVPQPSKKKIVRLVNPRSMALYLALILFAAAVLPHVSHARLQTSEGQSAAKKQKRRAPEFVPGEVLVRFREDAPAAKGQSRADAVTGEDGTQIPMTVERLDREEAVRGLRKVHVSPEKTLEAIQALSKRPDVLYAEPNYRLYADAVPNDPRFANGNLYALKNLGVPGADIKAEQAWNTTTGSRGIVVGVIDEGVDINHEDLKANVWTNPGETPGDGIDNDGNGFVDDVNGWDFANNDNTVFDYPFATYPAPNGSYTGDTDDHGTHVSGTIGAVGNNGTGVVGVNWQVSLMPLKFLKKGGGDDANAIKAVLYAKKMRDLWASSGGAKGANVRVLSNSYGGGGFSQAFLDAIKSAGDSGILFVAAAGNEGANNDSSPHYPSSYEASNLIAVASTTSSDTLSGFSNYGATSVNIAAPGSGIWSTTPKNTYSSYSGTSMATPHVSGAAAL